MIGCLVLPLLLLLLLPLAAVFAGTRRPSDLTGRFLWFTDNHVDLAGDINSPLDKRFCLPDTTPGNKKWLDQPHRL